MGDINKEPAMDWINTLSSLNWLAIIVATLSTFAVGYVWYSESVFGKEWAKLVGISIKEMNSGEGMAETFTMTGIASFIAAVVIGSLMVATGTTGPINGLVFGAIVGFAFRFGAHVTHNGFAKKSKRLTWIDGLHDVTAMAIIGLILGTWK